eukprot:CAMPEP_0194069860 /NCGR_PEP_ID=MMETSP0009_2-20130614/87870_1 /TAXON_ID=210454 /ORGANISM="Grammatophora oceanica, Strain CCMP 410" /LENGTH=205 /DNA_ID=CAMNT_0038723083 /DNA_START=230 /DNA_END=843 /DNA_ORIENTATION=-
MIWRIFTPPLLTACRVFIDCGVFNRLFHDVLKRILPRSLKRLRERATSRDRSSVSVNRKRKADGMPEMKPAATKVQIYQGDDAWKPINTQHRLSPECCRNGFLKAPLRDLTNSSGNASEERRLSTRIQTRPVQTVATAFGALPLPQDGEEFGRVAEVFQQGFYPVECSDVFDLEWDVSQTTGGNSIGYNDLESNLAPSISSLKQA